MATTLKTNLVVKEELMKHAIEQDDSVREDSLPAPEQVSILIVDDLPEKLMAYRTILEELGQNLVLAHSGEEALRLVLKQEFAVILLDVNMPGIDGFETANLIRKRKKSAGTPIIFLTAFIDEVHAAQGYASGAVDYLPTPVVPEILKAKVRVFIELSQMRRQAALQAEERARRTAAEEADRRKDEFLGMLAHELRNPLGPIRNAVHLMWMMDLPEPKLVQLRDIIDRQVSHMARLIDDLLDSTRLARGQILLRRETCNLGDVVRHTVEDYRSIYEESGLKLEVNLPPKPIMMEGDPTRLVQAIGNLMHNAHKFTDAGGTVTVELDYKKGNKYAQVKVRDTGIGIHAEILPHIFNVFQQAEQGLDRNRGGLGLGLSLVRGLVGLHDGKVTAASEGLGKGTEITIYLPVIKNVQNAPDTPAIEIPKVAECRILVIEDNPDTAESMRLLLDMEGHEVKIANSGTQGLTIARTFRPQVILCDIGLPGMDGYQVIRSIRSEEELSSIYVIALTGYGRDEDQRRAQEAGFNMHLTKPIDYNILRHKLAQMG